MISNKEELYEIEKITKLFIVEQRMIDITYNFETELSNKKENLKQIKKHNIKLNSYYKKIQLFNVKGLN
jgi:hypothetical protein